MSRTSLARILSLSAATILFTASGALAQEYGPPPGYDRPDNVIVIAPHRHYSNERSDIGAPIENVALTRPVRFDDLDLSTAWGARRLRERVRYTAHELCRRLDTLYPVSAPADPSDRFGSADCYRNAMDDGMDQADQAIDQARAYRD
ncbi:MAG: UrcA family protein [Rhizomicrobium sp.]